MTYVPQRPLRPCKVYGCPELTRERYCKIHDAEGKAEGQRTNREYDKHKRNQRAKAFYQSKEWQKVRQLYKLNERK